MLSANYILLFLCLFFMNCKQANEKNKLKMTKVTLNAGMNQDLVVDLVKLNNNKGIKGGIVHVAYDPNFKKTKTFQGFGLNQLIDSVVKANKFDTTNCLMIFKCADGYEPMMDFKLLRKSPKAFLVYKDNDAGDKVNWSDSLGSKYSPYYLVWDNIKKTDHVYPWPYGIVSISIVSINKAYSGIFPYNDAKLLKGFYLFRDNCMKCHSLNKIGGTIGPEFNVPKNITDYWTKANMLAYVQNPQSFRYNSRMPALTNLTDAEIRSIIEYVSVMKFKKIPK